MKVSVIIPNYNGFQYLQKCLDALDKQDFNDYNVIVVDDASTMSGVEEVLKGHRNVYLINHTKNLGFAASVNDGIKATDSKYVFLLNNDAYVEKDCISRLVKSMEENAGYKQTFSVQCKMISAVNHALIDNAGDFYNILGYARSRGKDKLTDSFSRPSEIFSACAGAAIYDREALVEIGLFDESHFAYLEDVDVGYRARLFGYINRYEPAAIVYHEGSATSGSRHNEFKVKLAARNSILIRYKNQTPLQKIVNFPIMEMGMIIKQLYFWRKGLGRAYRQGILEGRRMKSLPEVRDRKIQFDSSKRKRAWAIEIEMIKGLIY